MEQARRWPHSVVLGLITNCKIIIAKVRIVPFLFTKIVCQQNNINEMQDPIQFIWEKSYELVALLFHSSCFTLHLAWLPQHSFLVYWAIAIIWLITHHSTIRTKTIILNLIPSLVYSTIFVLHYIHFYYSLQTIQQKRPQRRWLKKIKFWTDIQPKLQYVIA